MPNEALVKFAEELKEARESKKITLQQIVAKTKIDIKFLEAIEESKFDILPELYIRAFIKEYAKAIDLNTEEVIKKFDTAFHKKAEEKSIIEKKEVQEIPTVKEHSTSDQKLDFVQTFLSRIKLKPNYNFGIAAAFVFLLLIYFIFIKNSSPEVVTQQASNSPVGKNTPAYEIDTPKTSARNIPLNDSLQLTLNTMKRVWVKVISDKNLRQEGMIDANRRLTYNASKEFRVVLGNAGNVQLTYNNNPISEEIVGKMGEVRNLIINPDTIRASTIIVPSKNENKSPETN